MFVYGNPFFYILADKILLQELDTKLVNLTSYYTVQEQIREIIDCISQITHCTFVSAKEHDALWKYDEGNPSLVYSSEGTPQINVCWDAWKRPVELGEIKQLWNNIKSS